MTNVLTLPTIKANSKSSTRLNEQGIVISLEQFTNILKTSNFNSKLVSFVYFGDYAQSRTKNGLKQLKKASYQRVFVGHNYQAKVNARLIAQAKEQGIEPTEFVAKKASGLEKVSDLLYVNKKGEYCLRAYLGHENSNGVEKVSQTKNLGYYTADFNPISVEEATNQDLFAPSHFKPRDYVSGRGLLTEKDNFEVRNFSLENIAKIVINNNVYVIR
jgi:hypothetical protein